MREVPTLIASLPATSEGQLTLTFASTSTTSPHSTSTTTAADNLFLLRLEVRPRSGLWAGGRFAFEVAVAHDYPFGRSRVRCLTPVYHPNISGGGDGGESGGGEGSVCLNILREDFSPAVHVEQMCHGMLFLLLNPNPESPLNDRAAREMVDAPDLFAQHVRITLQGGTLHGRRYPNCLAVEDEDKESTSGP
jgi:ubiquitin-protein ligase